MYIILFLIISIVFYSLLYYLCCVSKDFYYRKKNLLPIQNDETSYSTISYFDLLYFSIITQTTVGYGDIIPYSRKSKTLVVLQILTSLVILELSFDDWI